MRNANTPREWSVYTLRIEKDKLEQLREIAWTERRTVVDTIRLLIDEKIAATDRAAA